MRCCWRKAQSVSRKCWPYLRICAVPNVGVLDRSSRLIGSSRAMCAMASVDAIMCGLGWSGEVLEICAQEERGGGARGGKGEG